MHHRPPLADTLINLTLADAGAAASGARHPSARE
jgi:hypothetical protein